MSVFLFFFNYCVFCYNDLIAHYVSIMFFLTMLFSPSNKYTFRSTKYYVVVLSKAASHWVCDSQRLCHSVKRDEWMRKKACANCDVLLPIYFICLLEHSRPQPVVYLLWECKRCILCQVCVNISTCDQAVKQRN